MTQLLNSPYQIINIIFAGIVILIMLYSGFFSASKNNHPIECAVYKTTGKLCQTCGISRAFSDIVRLNFKSALTNNALSIKVFVFFFAQVILRVLFSLMIYKKFKRNLILYSDIIVSSSLFLCCFYELIFYV